ncbi:hypothetical protein ACVIJ6_006951 [Bradyrhizobium sp. USDA 4369]
MIRRQVPVEMESDGLLRAHHDGVGAAGQQHDESEQDVHHLDPLMVDAGDPFTPEIGEIPLGKHPDENAQNSNQHQAGVNERNGLAERYRPTTGRKPWPAV